MNKTTTIILLILLVGILYRIALTSNGNFLFNMDNGRDMVDVREAVVLQKLRLIGPTSAIEGLYNGPAWYLLLAVPFILSGGDPYAAIIMEIVLWATGGYFLMILVSKWGKLLLLPIGIIWIASDYVTLANRYAFNPNPVILLTPLFVYLLNKYIESERMIYGISTFLLGGLFFNFEMNFGLFIPLVIIISILLCGKKQLIKSKSLWVGFCVFIFALLPQIIFDIRHNFIMSKSVINFLLNGNHNEFNLLNRLQSVSLNFYQVFVSTLMHKRFLVWLVFGIISLVMFKLRREKNNLVLICFSLILVPFFGYLLLPVNLNLWHLGAEAAAFLILFGFVIKVIWDNYIYGKLIAFGLLIAVTFFSLSNIYYVFASEIDKPSGDPSLFRNEIAAIDYVYQKASGENFKVFTYLPSVYDYPYQYLFWWYGLKRYSYIPYEYAYLPNKPQYISNKAKFEGSKSNYSGLVFLVKEPDRINMRTAWENSFKDTIFISKQMVGPLEIEVRREIIQL